MKLSIYSRIIQDLIFSREEKSMKLAMSLVSDFSHLLVWSWLYNRLELEEVDMFPHMKTVMLGSLAKAYDKRKFYAADEKWLSLIDTANRLQYLRKYKP